MRTLALRVVLQPPHHIAPCGCAWNSRAIRATLLAAMVSKVLSGKTQRVVNRAAQALRLAAAALRSSKSALGTYFRRVCSRMDKPKAVTVAAHRLARLNYTMLTQSQEYTDEGRDYHEQRYRERAPWALSQRAAKLGMKMVPVEQPA